MIRVSLNKYLVLASVLALALTCNQTFAKSRRGACKYSKREYLRICQDHPGGPAWPKSISFSNGKSATFSEGKDRRVDPRLKDLLEKVSDKVRGNHIQITSAYRDCSYNYGVCGAVKSQHRLGNALDFEVAGYSSGQLQKIALSVPGVGGAGRYCSAASHMDTGPRRQWDWCGGGGAGKYKRHRKRA